MAAYRPLGSGFRAAVVGGNSAGRVIDSAERDQIAVAAIRSTAGVVLAKPGRHSSSLVRGS
jgi:hypothetical protein